MKIEDKRNKHNQIKFGELTYGRCFVYPNETDSPIFLKIKHDTFNILDVENNTIDWFDGENVLIEVLNAKIVIE